MIFRKLFQEMFRSTDFNIQILNAFVTKIKRYKNTIEMEWRKLQLLAMLYTYKYIFGDIWKIGMYYIRVMRMRLQWFLSLNKCNNQHILKNL